MRNVTQALRDAAARLTDASDTARLDAELLMADLLGMARSSMLLAARDLPEPAAFAGSVERRAMGEPVAYITGKQDFYGRSFVVTPDVLIPRADSETLIEAALPMCKSGARILDLGTGSGALLLTIVAETPDATGIGVDASPAALAIAELNMRRLGLTDRVDMQCGDWNRANWYDRLGTFDVVLANPPYVEEGAALDGSVRDYEPAAALFAGADGLDDYRAIIPGLRALMAQGGAAVLEIGHRQDGAVMALARQAGFAVTLHRDLADRPRALVLR